MSNVIKRMLIIHPHWPPSNTVGVHRVRLIANHLHHFGWEATVLTIDERDIEDDTSPTLNRLVNPEVKVVKVRANPIRHLFGKRLIGDIGIRGFSALRCQAKKNLQEKRYDFIWFSIPSWYTPLMGNELTRTFKVPFGIDYRDPWNYKLTAKQKGLNRAFLTTLAAKILEPIALKRAAMISAVSEAYVESAMRNTPRGIPSVFFQMGFDPKDHNIVLEDYSPPFKVNTSTYVYAGAYSANWQPLFSLWLRALAQLDKENNLSETEFLFIGTHNPQLPSITETARNLGISHLVREIPSRLPFLQVQQILRESSGALVIGSKEPHYSASKVFQCLITSPRILGFFHEQSEAQQILQECEALDFYCPYSEDYSEIELLTRLKTCIQNFTSHDFCWTPKMERLEKYNSYNNTKKFIDTVNTVI